MATRAGTTGPQLFLWETAHFFYSSSSVSPLSRLTIQLEIPSDKNSVFNQCPRLLAIMALATMLLGGSYAMEDTDSMAIVATDNGGAISCAGGKGGVIKALSWKEVKHISSQFDHLNPYDRKAVPGSILKIEDDNYDDPDTRDHQRQLYCLAVSAKRYTLFLRDNRGTPTLLRKSVNNREDRWSEHGLGHLLNPTDPESEDREWIAQAWLAMIRRSLSLPTHNSGVEHQPAIGRTSITSPAVMRPLSRLNEGKAYVDSASLVTPCLFAAPPTDKTYLAT